MSDFTRCSVAPGAAGGAGRAGAAAQGAAGATDGTATGNGDRASPGTGGGSHGRSPKPEDTIGLPSGNLT